MDSIEHQKIKFIAVGGRGVGKGTFKKRIDEHETFYERDGKVYSISQQMCKVKFDFNVNLGVMIHLFRALL
jgi:Fe-S cluster assembly ATPase SufC